MTRKATYTTGDVARLCHVSQQTIIRCFDSGKLAGFKVPNSKFRRITHDGLVAFMKEYGMKMPFTEDKQLICDALVYAELKARLDGSYDLAKRFRECRLSQYGDLPSNCPQDTNGDGDCGNRLCPICGTDE